MADFIKPLAKPSDVRRSFANNAGMAQWYVPKNIWEEKKAKKRAAITGRAHSSQWSNPRVRTDYAFLERCKILICRIPSPNRWKAKQGWEYRVHTMAWGNGSYLDLREYCKDHHTGRGMLIHLDVLKKLMPEMLAALRQMELDDQREEEQKSEVQVLKG